MLIYRLSGNLDDHEHLADLLWQAGASGLEERAGHIRAYFDEKINLPQQLAGGEWLQEAEQDWQAEFKKSLKPVQAGNLHVIAPWHERPTAGQVLVIEPQMAFGTGHHATTYMALEALQQQPLAGQRLLDVGTGSGVLAMAAHLLGASFAYGLDIDPITIPIARENARLNSLQSERLQFDEGSLHSSLAPLAEPFEVIVANLYAELHDILMPDYLRHLAAGGRLILTGILLAKLPLVQEALERVGFGIQHQQQQGEWALVVAQIN